MYNRLDMLSVEKVRTAAKNEMQVIHCFHPHRTRQITELPLNK